MYFISKLPYTFIAIIWIKRLSPNESLSIKHEGMNWWGNCIDVNDNCRKCTGTYVGGARELGIFDGLDEWRG
ncbi:MAG: hypothetical protein WBQ25_01555 [Nitrososphaeraceae archaeon]